MDDRLPGRERVTRLVPDDGAEGPPRAPAVRIGACAAVLAVALSAGSLALAEAGAEPLDRARSLMGQLEFGPAQEAIEEAIESGRLAPDELAEAYRRLAECFAALRRPGEAREAYLRVLGLDPGFEVPAGQSPLVRQPYEEAATFWRGRRPPSIAYLPPPRTAPGEPFIVEPEVTAGALPELAREVTLHLRGADGSYTTFVGAAGEIEVGARDFRGLDEIAFYLVLRDEHGNQVRVLGSPDEPLVVPVSEQAAGDRPEDGSPSPTPPRESGAWYRHWALWTVLGVVVVGLAVGLPVGLTMGAGADDPCERAFGGPCDLSTTLAR